MNPLRPTIEMLLKDSQRMRYKKPLPNLREPSTIEAVKFIADAIMPFINRTESLPDYDRIGFIELARYIVDNSEACRSYITSAYYLPEAP